MPAIGQANAWAFPENPEGLGIIYDEPTTPVSRHIKVFIQRRNAVASRTNPVRYDDRGPSPTTRSGNRHS